MIENLQSVITIVKEMNFFIKSEKENVVLTKTEELLKYYKIDISLVS